MKASSEFDVMNESEDFRASPFYAQIWPFPHHGQRRCNLILISNPAVNSEADFLKIARCIHDFDPKIKVTVVTNRWRGLAQMLAAAISPTLIVFWFLWRVFARCAESFCMVKT